MTKLSEYMHTAEAAEYLGVRLDKLFVEWAKKRQSSVLPEFEGKKDWTAAEAASLKALVPPALRDAPAK